MTASTMVVAPDAVRARDFAVVESENYDDLHGPLVFSTPERFDVILERDQEVLRAECVIDAS